MRKLDKPQSVDLRSLPKLDALSIAHCKGCGLLYVVAFREDGGALKPVSYIQMPRSGASSFALDVLENVDSLLGGAAPPPRRCEGLH